MGYKVFGEALKMKSWKRRMSLMNEMAYEVAAVNEELLIHLRKRSTIYIRVSFGLQGIRSNLPSL